MPPSLPRRIAEVQRAAGRLVWLAGMAWLAAAVVAATVALGLADYLLRPHDAALRWLLSATALGVAAWAAVKLALPVLSYHQGPIAVARRIERRFPQFG
jgi:hypothetical protein